MAKRPFQPTTKTDVSSLSLSSLQMTNNSKRRHINQDYIFVYPDCDWHISPTLHHGGMGSCLLLLTFKRVVL